MAGKLNPSASERCVLASERAANCMCCTWINYTGAVSGEINGSNFALCYNVFPLSPANVNCPLASLQVLRQAI